MKIATQGNMGHITKPILKPNKIFKIGKMAESFKFIKIKYAINWEQKTENIINL